MSQSHPDPKCSIAALLNSLLKEEFNDSIDVSVLTLKGNEAGGDRKLRALTEISPFIKLKNLDPKFNLYYFKMIFILIPSNKYLDLKKFKS